jgi:hypothetical protein
MQLFWAALLFNLPSLVLSIIIICIRFGYGMFRSTPLLVASQTLNILIQTIFIVSGINSVQNALDLRNIATFGVWEKLYNIGNTLSNLNLLLIWIIDIKILSKFKALDDRISATRIYRLYVSVICIFSVTRVLIFVQTGFQLFNSESFQTLVGRIPTTLVALGGLVQMCYSTTQVVFLTNTIFEFSKKASRKISESQYFYVLLYLVCVHILDWLAIAFFGVFTFFDRNFLYNNLVIAMIGVYAASLPVSLSKLTSVALVTSKRPTHPSRSKSVHVSSKKVKTNEIPETDAVW